jgi:hypothetical protein
VRQAQTLVTGKWVVLGCGGDPGGLACSEMLVELAAVGGYSIERSRDE